MLMRIFACWAAMSRSRPSRAGAVRLSMVPSRVTIATSSAVRMSSVIAVPISPPVQPRHRRNLHANAHLLAGVGQGHGQRARVEPPVRLTVDLARLDADAAGGQEIGGHAQDVARKRPRVRLEVKIHGLLRD